MTREQSAIENAEERENLSAEQREIEYCRGRLSSGFMKPHVFYGTYVTVETTGGDFAVPVEILDDTSHLLASNFADYVPERIRDLNAQLEIESGWLARLSATGFTDCTDWAVYSTELAAWETLDDMYGDTE